MGGGGGGVSLQKFFRLCEPQFAKNKAGGRRVPRAPPLHPLLLSGAALGVLLKVLSASYQVSHTKLNKVSKERQGPLARCPSCKKCPLGESRL